MADPLKEQMEEQNKKLKQLQEQQDKGLIEAQAQIDKNLNKALEQAGLKASPEKPKKKKVKKE